jgi:hypothetical protein
MVKKSFRLGGLLQLTNRTEELENTENRVIIASVIRTGLA